jgi:thiamine biosynthesis protein ThiI
MTVPAAKDVERIVIVRYGEIALKGGNRGQFERALRTGVKNAIRGIERRSVERPRGRIVVRGLADLPTARHAAERIAMLFGVVSASPASLVPLDLAAILDAAVAATRHALQHRGQPDGAGLTMKVEVNRVAKDFPHRSREIVLEVARVVRESFPALGVKMIGPDVLIEVEVLPGRAMVCADRMHGPGGLPVGSAGSALVLLSGGIDSPVAAWLAMKRGLHVECVYFHAPPFVGDASLAKVRDLVAVLAAPLGALRLHVIEITDVQLAIRKHAPEPWRTLLLRRAMNRAASKLAAEIDADALVTGETLAQVASQTIENLAVIEDAATPIVLRPLVAFDKEETIALARRIGCLEVSQRPHPDCCSLFQPAKPKLHGDVREARELEEALEALEPTLSARIDACVAGRVMQVVRADSRSDGDEGGVA